MTVSNSIHAEPHYSTRNSWLRASVLGANDGLISTASLLMGLVTANADSKMLLLTGIASLTAGAVSMAAGEYVSVSSQSDTENADLQKEAYELEHNAERELLELTNIYKARGLDDELAHKVAVALTKNNALEAHARDEIGLTDTASAKPLQAGIASALSFVVGAMLPIFCVWLLPKDGLLMSLGIATLFGLALLGFLSAKLGGAKVLPAVVRVVIWGVVALVATGLIGKLFGVEMAG